MCPASLLLPYAFCIHAGSPAAWQARGQSQPDVAVAGGTGVRVLVPDFASLGITPAAAAGGAYPNVPAPLPGAAAAAAGYDNSWLSQLPVPPGMSISAPSAPPAPAAAGAGAGRQQQQQQVAPPGAPAVSALPDYYSYIRPLPAEPEQQAAAMQPAVAAGEQQGPHAVLSICCCCARLYRVLMFACLAASQWLESWKSCGPTAALLLLVLLPQVMVGAPTLHCPGLQQLPRHTAASHSSSHGHNSSSSNKAGHQQA
jgi:hypothetical protein